MNTYDHATAPASWNDFNDAEAQQGSFDLIPRGISVPVRMTIKPGGHDDHTQGWTGGYATQSFDTGAVYLACEFVVTDGHFAKRKMWSNVGLHSPKGPTWGQMGRSFIRAALNSARNVHPQDNSPQAAAARRIAEPAAMRLVPQRAAQRGEAMVDQRGVAGQALDVSQGETVGHARGVDQFGHRPLGDAPLGIERGEALLDLRPPRERQQAQAFVGQPGEVGGLAQPAVWIQCGSAHCSGSLQMGGRAPHSGAATATRQDRTDDGAFGPRGPGWMNSRMPLHPSLRKARCETPSSHSSPQRILTSAPSAPGNERVCLCHQTVTFSPACAAGAG